MGVIVDLKCKYIIVIDWMIIVMDSESNFGVLIRFFYGEVRFFV